MSNTAFAELLRSTGLLSYQRELLDNGFDDADALCDMTEGDMAMCGIPVDHRSALTQLFTQMRATKAMAPQPPPPSNMQPPAPVQNTVNPGQMDWDPDPPAPHRVQPGTGLSSGAASITPQAVAHAPLGAEMLVPAATWTRVTDDAHVVQRLLALYFCWEYPIFASLSREHFVADFLEGRERFCSPLLVNALLALGSRFSGERIGTAQPRSPLPPADAFFEEALRLLDEGEDHHSLTTIQALGVMSLCEASCGRDTQGYHYSGQAIRLAVEIGAQGYDTNLGTDESAVRSATFWGAFGLDHAWALATHSLPSCSSSIIKLVPPKRTTSTPAEASLWVVYTDDDEDILKLQRGQTSNVVSVYNCFSELSELAHATLYSLLDPHRPPSSRALLDAYEKYLRWYNMLPDFFRLGHNSTPAVLFAHMYYHFAILQLFQPYLRLSISGSSISPRQVCSQAACTISTLLHSYSQLYSLRRAPCFLPQIVLSASVMQFSISASLAPHHDRPPSDLLLINHASKAVAQALSALDEMKASHPAARRAHYIISVLFKLDDLLADAVSRADSKEGSLGDAEDGMERELMSAWSKFSGRFVDIPFRSAAGARGLEVPPFWLIDRKKQDSLPSREQLVASGFLFPA